MTSSHVVDLLAWRWIQNIRMRLRFCISVTFLRKNRLDKQVFDLFTRQLTNRGLLFSKGTIVDGSFIGAPSSTKNADKKHDLEML